MPHWQLIAPVGLLMFFPACNRDRISSRRNTGHWFLCGVRSGRTADITVCQALFVMFIPVLNFSIRTGPELDDALTNALFFVGYNISLVHGDAPLIQCPKNRPFLKYWAFGLPDKIITIDGFGIWNQ
jgi:hypothetical protein